MTTTSPSAVGRCIHGAALMGSVFLVYMMVECCRAHAQPLIARPGQGDVITIRAEAGAGTVQRPGEVVGIFGSNSGARRLSLRRLVIPPGGRAKAHRHLGHESAVTLI